MLHSGFILNKKIGRLKQIKRKVFPWECIHIKSASFVTIEKKIIMIFGIYNIKNNDSGEELHSDLVGFIKVVEAKNLKTAISMVENMYPNNQIAREHSSKIG